MKKTIYNVFVPMKSQEQCDRMKQLCIDNGLPIWETDYAFNLYDNDIFGFSEPEFFIFDLLDNPDKLQEVTEQEFIELLKTTK